MGPESSFGGFLGPGGPWQSQRWLQLLSAGLGPRLFGKGPWGSFLALAAAELLLGCVRVAASGEVAASAAAVLGWFSFLRPGALGPTNPPRGSGGEVSLGLPAQRKSKDRVSGPGRLGPGPGAADGAAGPAPRLPGRPENQGGRPAGPGRRPNRPLRPPPTLPRAPRAPDLGADRGRPAAARR